jgi:hypothetical protein
VPAEQVLPNRALLLGFRPAYAHPQQATRKCGSRSVGRLVLSDGRSGVAVHSVVIETRILCMAAKQGPNVLFCMPNRTKCVLFSGPSRTAAKRPQPQRVDGGRERCCAYRCRTSSRSACCARPDRTSCSRSGRRPQRRPLRCRTCGSWPLRLAWAVRRGGTLRATQRRHE